MEAHYVKPLKYNNNNKTENVQLAFHLLMVWQPWLLETGWNS